MVRAMYRVAMVLLIFITSVIVILYAISGANYVAGHSGQIEGPSGIAAVPGGVDVPPSATPEKKQDEAITLPKFAHADLLSGIDTQTEQGIVILGTLSRGNLWLVERVQDGWSIVAGPLACRMGKEGLIRDKRHDDFKTPTGVTSVGAAFSSYGIDTEWELIPLQLGSAWVTDQNSSDYNKYTELEQGASYSASVPMPGGEHALYLDIGYNPDCDPRLGSAVLIKSVSNLTVATDGAIHVYHNTLQRIVEWLDPEKKPVVATFAMDGTDWQLEGEVNTNFVFASDVKPLILESPHFSSAANFTGRALNGYIGNRVMVSKNIAAALEIAQDKLQYAGYGLMVYNGYMPRRAVADVKSWLEEPEDGLTQKKYYDGIDKAKLASSSYIGAFDHYARGISVDLTLYSLSSGEELELGDYGVFDDTARYESVRIDEYQRRLRGVLREAMVEAGFLPDDELWWHFTVKDADERLLYYDFVIPQW